MTAEDDELHLLTGAYALDALDADERDAVEAYLATSEQARAEVASLSDTAVMLGLATTPEVPSADARARLLALVASTPQLTAAESAAETAAASADPAAAAQAAAARPTAAERKASRRWYRSPVTYAVAMAAAVAMFFGGELIVSRISASQQQLSASAIAEITGASDMRRASVEASTGGRVTLIWSEHLGKSAVLAKELPELPSGKTYELWYIDERGATPAGTFDAGSARTEAVLRGSIDEGDTVGITVEPAGGSSKPTTKPIVAIATT